MLLAAVETFPNECMGTLFGSLPACKKYHLITGAVPIQLAEQRTNDTFRQSTHSTEQLDSLISKAPELYPTLGSFHSHPEGEEKIKTLLELAAMSEASKTDRKNMRRTEEKIMIIVTLSSGKKLVDEWQSDYANNEGWIMGRLGDYNFYITAHMLLKKKGKKKKGKIKNVRIIAPEAIEALNRAQKKIENPPTKGEKKK